MRFQIPVAMLAVGAALPVPSNGRRRRAAPWSLGTVLAASALAWTSCGPAGAQVVDDAITLTLTVTTSSSAAYESEPDSGLDSDGYIVRMPSLGIRHRRETSVGPFSMSVRLAPQPDGYAPAPACMDRLDGELAESSELLKPNEEALQETRDALETLDSAIEKGLRTGVIEVGGLKVMLGPVDPDHMEFLKQRFHESLGQELRQDADRLARLLEEQYEAHARRVEIRNAAVPLCEAIDLLERVGRQVRRYVLTEEAARTAAAAFDGGRWSVEQYEFRLDGPRARYRLEASSAAWSRPPGAVDWNLATDGVSDLSYYSVEVLRLQPLQQERLRGIFASFGERVEEARELDAAWGYRRAGLEYDLRDAAGSALRTLWKFGLEPAPHIPSLLGEVGGEVAPVAVPELEGDTLVRLWVIPEFVHSFPVDVVGQVTIEQFREEPAHETAAIQLRLGERPSDSALRQVLDYLKIELATGLPTRQRLDGHSLQTLPGPDPFVSGWIDDWVRRDVVAHGSGTVRGTLLESWQESWLYHQVRHEVRYGWSVSVGATAVAETGPAEPRPEEEIELRVVTAEGARFRPIDGPLPFGRPFFIEGVLGEDSDRESLIVTLESGAGEEREIFLTRSPEDSRLLRSDMLYLMWEREERVDAGD